MCKLYDIMLEKGLMFITDVGFIYYEEMWYNSLLIFHSAIYQNTAYYDILALSQPLSKCRNSYWIYW